jgi:hypothetical protein
MTAYFRLTGFEQSPEEISKLIGLEPSRSWATGSERSNSKIPYDTSAWILESRLSESASLEYHLEDLLNQLEPFAGRIVALPSPHASWIEMVGYFDERYPGLSLDTKLLRRVSALGASLDFDFYFPDGDRPGAVV